MSQIIKEIKSCSPKQWNWLCEIFENMIWHEQNCKSCKKDGGFPCKLRPQEPKDVSDYYIDLLQQWLKAEKPKDSVDYLIKVKDSAESISDSEG